MTQATCAVCGGSLSLHDDIETGEILDCGDCGTELEVVGTDPVALDEAPDLAEDWGE